MNEYVAINGNVQMVMENDHHIEDSEFVYEYASEKLINAIKTACVVRNIQLREEMLVDLTNEIARDLLAQINEMPIPPSKEQIELIKKNCKRLGTECPDFSTLTGGREGTASKYIAKQIEIISHMPTEKQWETVKKFTYCLDEGVDQIAEELLARAERDDTPSKEEVSEFISTYGPVVAAWNERMATYEQVDMMIKINKKMGNRYDIKVFKNTPRGVAEKMINQYNLEYNRFIRESFFVMPKEDTFKRETVDVKETSDFVNKELRKLLIALAMQTGEDDECARDNEFDMSYIKERVDYTYEFLMKEAKTPGQKFGVHRVIENIINNCKCLSDKQKAELLYK